MECKPYDNDRKTKQVISRLKNKSYCCPLNRGKGAISMATDHSLYSRDLEENVGLRNVQFR